MERLVGFEQSLYGDNSYDENLEMVDVDFCVDRLVQFPIFRPHLIQKAIKLCGKYCNDRKFREEVLKKSIYKCPVLLYRLYTVGIFDIQEIQPFFADKEIYFACYYFRKGIKDFDKIIAQKEKPHSMDCSMLENENEIDLMIEFGFVPYTIEYCLKYDDIDTLQGMMSLTLDNIGGKAKWSPFEWSKKPDQLDFLSFSGYFGSVKCFKHLLLNGAKPERMLSSIVICSGNAELFHLCNSSNESLYQNISSAAQFNQFAFVKYFVENQIKDNNIADLSNALLNATQNGHLCMVEFLIKQGAEVNSRVNDMTNLHWAAAHGYLSIVELLVNNSADLSAKNMFNSIPLHWATINGHFKVAEYLVRQGSNINHKGYDQETPLHCAARKGHLNIVELLVNQGAVILAKNKYNYTPLHLAALNKRPSVLQFFSEKPEVKDFLFQTTRQGDLDTLKFMDYGNIFSKAKSYSTMLHEAASSGHLNIVEYLISQESDINSINNEGKTALHEASYQGHLPIVEYLTKHGAIVNIMDHNNRTAVELAKDNNMTNVVEFLLNHERNEDL